MVRGRGAAAWTLGGARSPPLSTGRDTRSSLSRSGSRVTGRALSSGHCGLCSSHVSCDARAA
eukprot:2178976-Prymnesium_polylepis.1